MAKVAYKKEENRLYQRSLRDEVFRAYGNECVCCNEREPEFLNLDHIQGGGTQERLKFGKGRNLWLELRRRGFPSGYQLLCANCNQARKNGKTCPHERAKASDKAPTIERTFSLPETTSKFIDKQCASGKCSTASEFVAKLIEHARVCAIEDQLADLIQEGLDSGEGEEVTDEWWEGWHKDADALRAFASGDANALVGSPRLTALLWKSLDLGSRMSVDKNDWKTLRERLLAKPPPGIYD